MKIKVTSLLIITALTALILGGCGGGGGGGSTVTTVSGTVAKGPVAGATVVLYAITAGAKGAELGRFAPTLADGKYSINIGAYTGPILIESTGGTYTDEATGTAAQPAGVFRAFADNAAGNFNVAVTPLTEMAAVNILAAAPVTAATIKSNNAAIANTFGVSNIIGVQPANPAAAPPAGTSQASIDYTLALATFAKYMQLNTLTLAQAMVNLGSAAPSAQTLLDLAAARSAFIADPVRNNTGVTGNQAATTITLKLSTTGTLAVADAIGGVEVTLNLPAGVSIANTAGDASASVVASGVAVTGSTVGASFVDAAPDTVKVIVVKQPNGFGIGEYATVTLTKTAGAIVTPAHIIATGFKAANGIVGNGELGAALPNVAHTFTATFQ